MNKIEINDRIKHNEVERYNGRKTEKDIVPKYEIGLSANKKLPVSEEDITSMRKTIEKSIDKKIKDDIIAVIDTVNIDDALGALIVKNEPIKWIAKEENGRYTVSGTKIVSIVGYTDGSM